MNGSRWCRVFLSFRGEWVHRCTNGKDCNANTTRTFITGAALWILMSLQIMSECMHYRVSMMKNTLFTPKAGSMVTVLIAQATARGRLFCKHWCQKFDLIDFRNEYICVIALFDLFVLCFVFSFDDDDDDDRFYIALFSALEQTHCARMWFYMSD